MKVFRILAFLAIIFSTCAGVLYADQTASLADGLVSPELCLQVDDNGEIGIYEFSVARIKKENVILSGRLQGTDFVLNGSGQLVENNLILLLTYSGKQVGGPEPDHMFAGTIRADVDMTTRAGTFELLGHEFEYISETFDHDHHGGTVRIVRCR